MKQPIAVWITDTHLSESTIDINKSIFTQVFALCNQLNTKTIIHGGDVFTSRKGQSEKVLNAWKEILDEAAEQSIKILAIPGNHDKTDLTSSQSFLTPFDGHVAFKVMDVGDTLLSSVVDLSFLPYYDETLTYPGKLEEVNNFIDEEKVNILCTHAGIDDALMNGGQKVEGCVKKESFAKFDFVISGHYHDRQTLMGGKIIYTGAGYQANYGEDEHKGVVIIYDDPEPFEFISLEFKKYVTVDILPEDLTGELVSQVIEKQTEANVRIRIAGEVLDDKKNLVMDLQKSGAKVKVEKEAFDPKDISQNKKLIMTSGDIMTTFEEWAADRKIEDSKYGKALLQKML